MQISIPNMEISQKKSKFLKFKMADGRHIENRFWLYSISTPYWPINAKFGMEMTNHMEIGHVTKKWKFFQIHD